MRLLRLSVMFSVIFMIAGLSTSGFADTGFTPAVEKAQVFTAKTVLASTSECQDTDTISCKAGSAGSFNSISKSDWPDPGPVPAMTAKNSSRNLNFNVCHVLSSKLRPG